MASTQTHMSRTRSKKRMAHRHVHQPVSRNSNRTFDSRFRRAAPALPSACAPWRAEFPPANSLSPGEHMKLQTLRDLTFSRPVNVFRQAAASLALVLAGLLGILHPLSAA